MTLGDSTPALTAPRANGFQGEMEYFGMGKYCGYAYALVSANRASLDRTNAWISADYELSDNTEVFFDLVWTEVDSFGSLCASSRAWPSYPWRPKKPRLFLLLRAKRDG